MKWNAMTDREKDAAVAESVLKMPVYKDMINIKGQQYLAGAYDAPIDNPLARPIPSYTTDHHAVTEVEAALERRGLVSQYVDKVLALLPVEDFGADIQNDGWRYSFALLTAPLDIRCRAALTACGVEIE